MSLYRPTLLAVGQNVNFNYVHSNLYELAINKIEINSIYIYLLIYLFMYLVSYLVS